MMPVERIDTPDDPRLGDYARVREPELLRARGVFIAESREVVRLFIQGRRFPVRSVLVTDTVLAAMDDVLRDLGPEVSIYVAARTIIESVVGYNVHRGCLAAGERDRGLSLPDLWRGLSGPLLLPVLEGVTNPDNIGGIFRNALAFGCAGVVLGPGCADPLYRKAIRVSVGAALRVPFAVCDPWPAGLDALKGAGFTLLALSTDMGAVPLTRLTHEQLAGERVAMLLGSEGQGLSVEALARAALQVRIPMAPGVDSLNVATAAGIGLYELSQRHLCRKPEAPGLCGDEP
jgi:tRNA G18 (ribose-2'-O)-methylase SpoU